MAYPHDRKCPTNPYSPEPVGICDRTGFKLRLDDMPWQFDWRGNKLANLRVRVGNQYQDIPNEQRRPIIVGPDPVPPRDPRPASYVTAAQGGQPPILSVAAIFTDYIPQTVFLGTETGAYIVTETGARIRVSP